MSIWAEMMTALRGGLSELGETVVDSQALRILDQEVREAAEQLQHSKNSLAEIMARQKQAQKKCSELQQQVTEHEGYALKALEKGDEALAYDVAEKIADLESQQHQVNKLCSSYGLGVDKLRGTIVQAERNIKRLKQQLDTVKATENVQRAQVAVAQRHAGPDAKVRTAMDSLARIKERQALKDAQLTAADELITESKDASLQRRLEQAGICKTEHNAGDVLARLQAKK